MLFFVGSKILTFYLAEVEKTPIGYTPTIDGLDLKSLDVPVSSIKKVLRWDPKEWAKEIE